MAKSAIIMNLVARSTPLRTPAMQIAAATATTTERLAKHTAWSPSSAENSTGPPPRR